MIIKKILLFMILIGAISCGEDKLHLFKLKGDIRKRWVQTLGQLGKITISKIVNDSTGNIYIAGCFVDTVDFDPGTGIQNRTSNSDTDAFVLKLNRFGEFCWVITFGELDGDNISVITIGSDDCIYLAGIFMGSIDFDPGISEYILSSQSAPEPYVLKLDNEGKFCWAKKFTSSFFELICAGSDNNGNLYLSGIFEETADFDPGEGVVNRSVTGGVRSDIFVLKLNSRGEFVWVQTIGSTIEEKIHSIAVDSAGNCYLAGYFKGTVDFDPGTSTVNRSSQGGKDAFILKLDPFGSFCWVNAFGGTDDDAAYDIAVSPNGFCYVVGNFRSTVDFDTSANVQNKASNGYADIFVLKLLSKNGNFFWVNAFGGTSADLGNSISFDQYGNYYVGGYFCESVDFDFGSFVKELTSVGNADAFIAKFGADDQFCWVNQFGSSGFDAAYHVLIDQNDYCYLAGIFQGTVNFGTSTSPELRTSKALSDYFLMKLPKQ